MGLGVLFALVLLLGIAGHWQHYGHVGQPCTLLDCLHATLQLITFNSNLEPGPKPWLLEAARLLAPLTAAYAVLLALMELLNREFRLRRLSGHVIVCGLGRKGLYLARRLLAEGQQVVAIEQEESAAADACRRRGGVVLIGDARDPALLRAAHVERASHVVALCGGDAANVRIAMSTLAATQSARPDGLPPMRCSVHIVDLTCCEAFRSLGVFAHSRRQFTPLFNFYENCARAALSRYPLDRVPIRPQDTRVVHLVILGLGQMGEALLLQAARLAHFANLRKPRLTVVDESGTARKGALLSRYPGLEQVADLEFVAAEMNGAEVRSRLADWARDESSLLTLAVCTDHEVRALSYAFNLPPEIPEHGVQVLVRMSDEPGLAQVVEQEGAPAHLKPFGMVQHAHLLDSSLDAVAQALHAEYLAQAAKDGQKPEENPALCPWEELPEAIKVSNRHQADHIPVKLRAVGCEAVPKAEERADAAFQFAPEEVELLARMEHSRWCAERLLAGWTPGSLDRRRKRTPYLVPYDQLEEPIKEYDRRPVRG